MITIPLSKQGKNAGKYEAIVDDCDADLAELNWYCVLGRHTNYVSHNIPIPNNKQKKELMHRVILSRILKHPLERLEHVDHIDGNGLNNQRSNLRVASRQQNMGNSNRSKRNTSGFKGVGRRNNKYRALIRINQNLIHLGYFDTPEEAHAAYCEAAKEYFGEFANNG